MDVSKYFNPPPPKKKALTTDFLSKPNATMNYHDSICRNNERNHLDSYFICFKPLLGAFKFIKDYLTYEGVIWHIASVLHGIPAGHYTLDQRRNLV